MTPSFLWFKDCNYQNKNLVGGKNASLGELYHLSQTLKFNIADGFAITTRFYQDFLAHNGIQQKIESLILDLDPDDIEKLHRVSTEIKTLILESTFTPSQISEMETFYQELGFLYKIPNLEVAVRSSAVAEDLPDASFAGQQDTYLNMSGITSILDAVKKCFASLFNSRAISYRKTHKISFSDVLISVGIQKMIRSDLASSGVAFSLDPETGYSGAIVINCSFGLGELVVSGGVKPDEIVIDKRVLSLPDSDPIIMKNMGDKNTKIVYDSNGGTAEIPTEMSERVTYSISDTDSLGLAHTVASLEKSYSELFQKSIGIDVEWAIDGTDKKVYIIQSRPETIHSNSADTTTVLTKYHMTASTSRLETILTGVAVGEKISTGKVCVLSDISEYASFVPGEILVTDMTTPDWEPLMKISSGIITNKGGRTCHAAIVAREMGLNAIVGTQTATTVFGVDDPPVVTMNCAEGEVGQIYRGTPSFEKRTHQIDTTKKLPVKLMLNVGSPENAFSSCLLPCQRGVGLARLEFIITNYVRIHPLALYDYPNIREDIRDQISEIIKSDDGAGYFIKQLARGIAKIASAFYPHDVIVRLSDFKSNEYRNLIGGELYEPSEENPMIGWRGASRYYSSEYSRGFSLECQALKYVRDTMKMTNTMVMIPFCRTPEECRLVTESMNTYGLVRGENGLKFILMCEIPSNVIEADNFSPYIDGVSIGGNDLLQLTLGVDRDSERITALSSDKNISYRRMISKAIHDYHKYSKTVGFCGQQPSDSPEFCQFLISEGIDSFSVTPDSALNTISQI